MLTTHAQPREAHLVVDLGFGDAGKGTVTDWLVRRHGAGLVVRFNGGAQAGHNVITDDGRHHTFSQFGAGTFVPGTRTWLARTAVLHPLALLVEAKHLAAKGVPDALARFRVSAGARVITPFHQAAGRLRELARGAGRHGTCGVGVGETVRDALAHPDSVIVAGDLASQGVLLRKAREVQDRLRAELSEVLREAGALPPEAEKELAFFVDADVPLRWVRMLDNVWPRDCVAGDERLGEWLREGTSVFEGAQGVLLDEWRGFHPHTTWSTCTFEHALELLRAHDFDAPVHRLGVLRTYATRHGEGPLPTQEAALEATLSEPHNDARGWQGRFRVGHFDAVLARYALATCGGVEGLALTHLDRLEPRWPVCSAYRAAAFGEGAPSPWEVSKEDDSRVVDLRLGPPDDLAYQERLTRALGRCEPVREVLSLGEAPSERAERFVAWVEDALGVRVALTSHGPSARDKRERPPGTGPTG